MHFNYCRARMLSVFSEPRLRMMPMTSNSSIYPPHKSPNKIRQSEEQNIFELGRPGKGWILCTFEGSGRASGREEERRDILKFKTESFLFQDIIYLFCNFLGQIFFTQFIKYTYRYLGFFESIYISS